MSSMFRLIYVESLLAESLRIIKAYQCALELEGSFWCRGEPIFIPKFFSNKNPRFWFMSFLCCAHKSLYKQLEKLGLKGYLTI